jgi:hypothetical protein
LNSTKRKVYIPGLLRLIDDLIGLYESLEARFLRFGLLCDDFSPSALEIVGGRLFTFRLFQ